jgi:hypothetical protein
VTITGVHSTIWSDVKAVKAATPNIMSMAPPASYSHLNQAQKDLLADFLKRLPDRDKDIAKKCPCSK